jgi:hypothetical protein
MASPLIQIDSTGSVNTGSVGPQANPEGFSTASGLEGKAQQQLGNVITEGTLKVTQAFQDRKAQDEALWVAKTEANTREFWVNRYNDLSKDSSEGFSERVSNEYKTYVKDLVTSAPSKEARDRLGIRLQNFGSSLLSTAFKEEASTRVTAVNNDLESIAGSNAMALSVPGGYDRLDEIRTEQKTLIGSMAGRVENISDKIQKTDSLLIKAALEGLIQNGKGAQALSDIDSGRFSGSLNASEALTLRSKAVNSLENQNVLNSSLARDYVKNSLSIMETTGGLPQGAQDIESAVNKLGEFYAGKPDKQKLAMDEFRSLLTAESAAFGYLQVAKTMPYNNAAALIDKLKPKADDPQYAEKIAIYDQTSRAFAKYGKLLDEDPAAAINNTSLVQASLTEFQKATDKLQDGSGTQQEYQAAQDKYFQTVLAAEELAGVPKYKQTVIGKSTAEELVAAIKNSTVDSVENEFNQMQSYYGKHFASVLNYMTRLPGESKLDSRYQMLAMHLNKPYTGELVKALQTDPKELDKLIADDTIAKDITKTVAVNGSTLQFQEAVLNAGSNPDFVNGAISAATSFAKYRYIYSKTGVKESTALSSQTLFGTKFDYGKVNGHSFAIPKQKSDGSSYTQEELSKINSVLHSQLSKLSENTKPENIDGYSNTGIESKVAAERYIKNFQTLGYWANANDFSGVYFVMNPDPQLGFGKTRTGFVDNNGKKLGALYFSFEEILKMEMPKPKRVPSELLGF